VVQWTSGSRENLESAVQPEWRDVWKSATVKRGLDPNDCLRRSPDAFAPPHFGVAKNRAPGADLSQTGLLDPAALIGSYQSARSREAERQVRLRIDAATEAQPCIRLEHLDEARDVRVEFVKLLGGDPKLLMLRRPDDVNGIAVNPFIGDAKACDETRVFRVRVLRIPVLRNRARVFDVQDRIEDGLMRQPRWKSAEARVDNEPKFRATDRSIEYQEVPCLSAPGALPRRGAILAQSRLVAQCRPTRLAVDPARCPVRVGRSSTPLASSAVTS
jgi:hypothetical protein